MTKTVCVATISAALALAGCGDPGGTTPPDDAAPASCVSLRGAARLLPAHGRGTAPETAENMAPDEALGGVVLAPLARVGELAEASPLPRGAHDGAGFAHDGWLYILGGQRERLTGERDLLAARIGDDGALGAWRAATAFRFGIIDHLVRVHAGRAYLTGGAQSLGNDMFRQLTTTDVGTFGEGDVTWTPGTANPVRRFGHEAVIAAGYLYTIGGDDGFNATDDVSFAAILPDGALGPWRRTTPVPEGTLQFLSGAGTGRHVYAIGGCRRKDCLRRANIEDRIFVADVLPDGALGPWREGGRLPVPNFDAGAAVGHGRVFVTGGRPGGYGRCTDVGGDNYADVWWADLRADGTLGDWQGGAENGARMPRPRSDHAVVFDHLGNVWMYGGRTSCVGDERQSFNNNYPTTVWRAAMVPESGRARAGSWLSGPLSPPPERPGARARAVRVSASGPGLTVRVRTFADGAWGPWSEPTAAREVALPTPAATVQVLALAEGDGTATPVLSGVDVVCN